MCAHKYTHAHMYTHHTHEHKYTHAHMYTHHTHAHRYYILVVLSSSGRYYIVVVLIDAIRLFRYIFPSQYHDCHLLSTIAIRLDVCMLRNRRASFCCLPVQSKGSTVVDLMRGIDQDLKITHLLPTSRIN
eukprot:GHVS01082315.1.p1 GENE.GHVS01082315.1~~GHVS01082315.1.p1  ORF type:complete len:130 (+),score=7.13 GHVS01082315.1:261-650(+)